MTGTILTNPVSRSLGKGKSRHCTAFLEIDDFNLEIVQIQQIIGRQIILGDVRNQILKVLGDFYQHIDWQRIVATTIHFMTYCL